MRRRRSCARLLFPVAPLGLAAIALACGDSPVQTRECTTHSLQLSAAMQAARMHDHSWATLDRSTGYLALALAEEEEHAGPGSSAHQITGSFASARSGRASGFESAVFLALTVLDGYVVDADGRPLSELVVVLRSRAVERPFPLGSVSLAQLRDPSFTPEQSFAVFADQYDYESNEYARWLLADEGCVTVTSVEPGRVGRVAADVVLEGTWYDPAGEPLGTGSLAASIEAPLLRFLSVDNSTGTVYALRDSLEGSTTPAAETELASNRTAAYQVWRGGHTRMTVWATDSGETGSRIVLLNIPDSPRPGDVIEFGENTVDDVLAGRGAAPFGALLEARLGAAEGDTLSELWRSVSGHVRFTNVVQNGPLSVCGWATGYFEFAAAGTDMSDPARPSLEGERQVSGTFETRVTILSAADTLVPAVEIGEPVVLRRRAPGREPIPVPFLGVRCPI